MSQNGSSTFVTIDILKCDATTALSMADGGFARCTTLGDVELAFSIPKSILPSCWQISPLFSLRDLILKYVQRIPCPEPTALMCSSNVLLG